MSKPIRAQWALIAGVIVAGSAATRPVSAGHSGDPYHTACEMQFFADVLEQKLQLFFGHVACYPQLAQAVSQLRLRSAEVMGMFASGTPAHIIRRHADLIESAADNVEEHIGEISYRHWGITKENHRYVHALAEGLEGKADDLGDSLKRYGSLRLRAPSAYPPAPFVPHRPLETPVVRRPTGRRHR